MLLLVSVRNAREASAAVAGGADIIDAKDPESGALGPVGVSALSEIHRAASPLRPLSAALGDATDEDSVEHDARAYANAGAVFVKVGFGGVSDLQRAQSLLGAAVRGSQSVIAVGYADAPGDLTLTTLIEIAARSGARGVLLDTVDKRGPGLRELIDDEALARWIDRAHAQGLIAAVAGSLRAEDLAFVQEAGADVAGVRGAACDGGRNGTISEARIRRLRSSYNRRLTKPSGLVTACPP